MGIVTSLIFYCFTLELKARRIILNPLKTKEALIDFDDQ